MRVRNIYAGGTLDRASGRRRDRGWVRALLDHPASRVIAHHRGRFLIEPGDPPRPLLLPPRALGGVIDGAVVALLGLAGEGARFAVDLSGLDEGALPGAGSLVDLRAVGGLMAAPDAAMLAHARGLFHWHARQRFCGVCGAPTEVREGGHLRVCTDPACAAPQFPRTDPAVIMLVHDGGRCIMARQARWPAGRYSVLAGFVEPGEALEEAVAREVAEEVGVAVADIRYHSSQPWPFPASIMLGFHARAVSTALRIDPNELEDARWVCREALRNPPEGFRLPSRDSIARRLIEDWLAGG